MVQDGCKGKVHLPTQITRWPYLRVSYNWWYKLRRVNNNNNHKTSEINVIKQIHTLKLNHSLFIKFLVHKK